MLGGPGVEHLELPDLAGVGHGPPASEHGLAVDGDHVRHGGPVRKEGFAFDPLVRFVDDRADHGRHRREELLPPGYPEASLERVVARYAAGQREPFGKPFLPLLAVPLDVDPVVGAGQYGEEGHGQNLGEDVPAVGLVPRVGERGHRLPYRHDHRRAVLLPVAFPIGKRVPDFPEHRVGPCHIGSSKVTLGLQSKPNSPYSTRFRGKGKPRT